MFRLGPVVVLTHMTAIVLTNPVMAATAACPALGAETQAEQFVLRYKGTPAYQDLLPLPMTLKKAILHMLPPEDRARLWREHFLSIDVGGLRVDQQARLQEAAGLLTPELFRTAEVAGPASVDRQVSRIRGILSAAFPPEEVHALLSFSTSVQVLFPDGSPGEIPTDIPDCRCNTYWPDDCPGSLVYCKEDVGGELCTHQSWGCGNLWLYECNGRCCFVFRPGICG